VQIVMPHPFDKGRGGQFVQPHNLDTGFATNFDQLLDALDQRLAGMNAKSRKHRPVDSVYIAPRRLSIRKDRPLPITLYRQNLWIHERGQRRRLAGFRHLRALYRLRCLHPSQG
jgi:hypothetical protein